MNKNVLLFACAMALAGTIGVFVTEAHISTLNAVFFRCLIVAILLGGHCWTKGLLRKDIFVSPEFRFIALGGIALVANWAFLFQAFKLSSITIGIISYYTAPFFLIFLGTVILKEKFTTAAVLWTLLAFGGLVMTATTGQQSILNNQGVLLGMESAICAALLYACMTTLGKKVQTTDPAFVVFIQMAIGTVVLLPFIYVDEALNMNTGWGYVLALGVIHTALLYLLFYKSVRSVPVALLAPLAFIDPVVAILSDVAVYATKLSTFQIIGILIILVSAYFVGKPRKERIEPQDILRAAVNESV